MSSYSENNEKGAMDTADMASPECARLCDFCGKIFQTTAGLYTHNRVCKLNNNRNNSNHCNTLPSSDQLLCIYCGKAFAFKSGLSRHERFCKKNNFPFFKCEICLSSFSRADNFKNHMRKCSSGGRRILNTYRFQCMYQFCSAVFFHKNKLTLHLRKCHGSRIEDEQVYDFENVEEFLKWKHDEEAKTHFCFTKRSGTKGKTAYYHCQHDGSSKPHCKTGDLPRKTERKIRKGMLKQDKVCLARITNRVLEDGSCKVTYQPTHSHELNIKNFNRSPLLTATIKFINHQLSMGVSPKHCFKDLSEGLFHRKSNSVSTSVQECTPSFVSKIEKLNYSKRMKMRTNEDDSMSVMIKAVLLSKEDPNPIILYKPLGSGKIIGPSSSDKFRNVKDMFMLGIQTKEQRNTMLLGAKIILCVSTLNDTNAYGYPLLTLTVPDKFNRGYPVGFFISSSMDHDSVSCFFAALIANCPELVINCIIAPGNPSMYNAIKEGLQLDISHIWCLRHVHRNFHTILFNLVPAHLVQELYNILCLMINVKDPVEFKTCIAQFVSDYSAISPDFLAFFNGKYLPSAERWVMAYRDFHHGNVETTVFNDAIHNRIEMSFVKERDNRRLDDLVNILFDLEEDVFRKYAIEEMLGVPFGVGNVSICHGIGLKITDDNIVQVHETLWEIKTDNDLLKKCEVTKFSNCCISNECYFVCDAIECNNLCSHMFACTCLDRNPLCKHVHKIRELTRRKELIANETSLKIAKFSNVVNTDIDEVNHRFQNISNYMQQLMLILKEQKIPDKLSRRIESSLEGFLVECRGSSSTQDEHSSANRYEFAYETVTITKTERASSIPNDSVRADHPVRSSITFTPSLDYANLNEIIFRCGIEELSLLHLKLLDPFLTLAEISLINNSENNCTDWMYSTVMNAFCYQLQLRYLHIAAIHSDVAFILVKKELSNKLRKEGFPTKDMLIMPINVTHNYWTCIAIFVHRNEIIYFNSKESISKLDKTVIENLQLILAKNVRWKVTVANYDFQNDGTSCGAQVCHFAEQIANEADLTPLIDVQMYRKHIYKTIVGGCLNRDRYKDTTCGKCRKHVCTLLTDETAQLSICCDSCSQWFHVYCLGLQAMDITNMRFTCPLYN